MGKLIVILIISLLTSSCFTNRDKQGDRLKDEELVEKLDSIGEGFIQQGKILGLSIAIMQGKDTLYNKGFGFTDSSKTQPVTNQTRFLMASVSKLILSTVVMKLVEEGKLSLNQTLFDLLPEFPNPNQAKKITIKHMLSNTSGLQDYASEIDSAYVKTGITPSTDDFYNFFKGKELFFEPGTNYSYSNSGFLLMGIIVEKITGNSFQDEINRIINESLGIKLQLISNAVDDPKMSDYYELNDSIFNPSPHWTWIKGDGGLTATAIDLAQFPLKWSNAEIINQESYMEMITPITLVDGIQTGYGIGVRNGTFLGNKIIGHTGGNKSTYSIMAYFPDRYLTFVVFINTDNSPTSVRKIFSEFARTVLARPTPNYTISKDMDINLNEYVGSYETYDYMANKLATIELDQDNLLYCIDGECEPMIYLGEHKFWIKRWPYDYVEFHVNNEGIPLAMKEYFNGFYTVLRKKNPH